jgi:hypothetical protein
MVGTSHFQHIFVIVLYLGSFNKISSRKFKVYPQVRLKMGISWGIIRHHRQYFVEHFPLAVDNQGCNYDGSHTRLGMHTGYAALNPLWRGHIYILFYW